MILRYRANAVYRSESGDTPCIRLPVVLEGSSEAMHSWMLPYRTVPDSIHSGHPQPPPAQYPLPYQYARTEPTRRAGLSLFVLSLSLPPLAHLLLPVFPLFLFLFFFFFFFLFFFPFFPLLLATGVSRNSASTSIAFSLSFGRHSRFLVSCLTAGAKRCVGFGPPSPFCASSLLCYIFYSPLFFAWI